MNSNQSASFTQSYLTDDHQSELKASAINDITAGLNFYSFESGDEEGANFLLEELNIEIEHTNPGMPSGQRNQKLVNALMSGAWGFQGHKGICAKVDSPLTFDGKTAKYLSVFGKGNQQIYIPKVTFKIGLEIATKSEVRTEYIDRFDDSFPSDRSLEDKGFWDWVLTLDKPLQLIITEGAKKACSLISAGYLAIGLNGMWGWGSNVKAVDGEKADKYKNKLDDKGKAIKLIHPDLMPFLKKSIEIVWALDRDENRTNPDNHKKAIDGVKQSKASFKTHCGSLVKNISDTVWTGYKGVDDLIAAEGAGAFQKAFSNRSSKKVVSTEKNTQSKPKTSSKNDGDSPSIDEPKKYITPLELAKVATYFHTADKVAYADISIEGNRHTYAVKSKAFKLWLMGEHYKANKSGINSQSYQDTLPTLEAIAIFDGETREVHLRTAEHQGKLYLDLGTPDWKAVEIDSSGWRVISEPPVRFWRPDSLLPLPCPVEGGSLDELKDLLNVDGSSWILIVTFLLFCFCPDKTYPVLVLAAHRGSGKTAAAEILKGLIDPGKAGLIKLQGDTHKLAIAATRRHLMVYDNVGHITPDQSDDLCRVATGFGYSTRTLHTTGDETTFEFTRPQIITAIDALVTRDDLADRVLMAQLPEIPEDKRLPQGKLNEKVEAARPRILGALLTAVSQTLAQLPHTNPESLPRMADYALFAIASEKALGLKEGEFMKTFSESREQSRQVVIESSPVGEAIIRLMEKTHVRWRGTASELLNELEKYTDDATYRSRYFPKAANHLKQKLNRLAPDLKALGIQVSETVYNGSKKLVLERVIKVSTPSTPKTPEPQPDNKNSGVDTGVDGVDKSKSGVDKISDSNPVPDSSNEINQCKRSGVDTFPGVDTGVDEKTAIDTKQTSSQKGLHGFGVDGVDKNTPLPVVGEVKKISEVPADEF